MSLKSSVTAKMFLQINIIGINVQKGHIFAPNTCKLHQETICNFQQLKNYKHQVGPKSTIKV